jgi:hypothetical protein
LSARYLRAAAKGGKPRKPSTVENVQSARDVDWIAGVIRVRRNYVRGRYGTPKSRRSSRAVRMADEVGGVLDRLFESSAFHGDDDHVFAHRATGQAIPRRT